MKTWLQSMEQFNIDSKVAPKSGFYCAAHISTPKINTSDLPRC